MNESEYLMRKILEERISEILQMIENAALAIGPELVDTITKKFNEHMSDIRYKADKIDTTAVMKAIEAQPISKMEDIIALNKQIHSGEFNKIT